MPKNGLFNPYRNIMETLPNEKAKQQHLKGWKRDVLRNINLS